MTHLRSDVVDRKLGSTPGLCLGEIRQVHSGSSREVGGTDAKWVSPPPHLLRLLVPMRWLSTSLGEEGRWGVNRRKLSLMSWALPFSPHPSLPLRSQGWSGGPGRGSTAHLFFCPPTSRNQCISALLHWWGGHCWAPTGTADIVLFSLIPFACFLFSLCCLIWCFHIWLKWIKYGFISRTCR